MKYRKKPIVVEAVQWTGANMAEIERLFVYGTGSSVDWEGHTLHYLTSGCCEAPDQHFHADPFQIGDWFVSAPQDHIIVLDPDEFKATYEKVEE